VPQPPVEGPLPTDQVNLTDEESRIMPVAGGGFEQCYNAQAVVAADSLLVVAAGVVQAPNDKQQLEPMLGKIAELPAELGKVGELLADNGYFSEGNVNACAAAGIEPVIAMGREAHHPTLAERSAQDPTAPENPNPVEAMRHRLQTKAGKKRYALRRQTPEPVFRIIKSVIGFRQFMLRGLNKVRGEWSLLTMAWNMKRMFALAGGELSRIVPFAIRFGVFAHGKPRVGIARAKSSIKVESLLRVRHRGACKCNTPTMIS
jgi:Transposase DDE domain